MKVAAHFAATAGSFRQTASKWSPGLRLKLRVAAFGLAVAVIGLVLDLGMARLLHRFWAAEIAGNVFTGVLAGYGMFRYCVYRVNISKQRAAQIGYLNHHVRNALSLIVFSHHSGDTERLKLIQEASERIQETLKQFAREDDLQLPALQDLPVIASATPKESGRPEAAGQ